jgi:hypothetical protein
MTIKKSKQNSITSRYALLLQDFPSDELKQYLESWNAVAHKWAEEYVQWNFNLTERGTQRAESSHTVGQKSIWPPLVAKLKCQLGNN